MKIIVDHRERNIVNELKNLELDVELRDLKAGDFALSEKVGVELKTREALRKQREDLFKKKAELELGIKKNVEMLLR